MKDQKTLNELQPQAVNFRAKFENLKLKSEGLPEAARLEIEEKFSRAETMLQAFERDAEEVLNEAGAPVSTTEELAQTVEKALHDLKHELDFLGLGNPTTIDAAIDATDEVVEKAVDAIKKVTSKVHLPNKSEKN